VTEIVGAVLFVALGLRYDICPELAMWMIFAVLLFLLSLIDWYTFLLPDKILLLAVMNRIVFLFLLGQPLRATLIAMLIGACSISVPLLILVLIMDRVLGKETMGGGDIKLLFVLGLYMNWMQMFLILLVGCILALAAGLYLRRKSPEGGIAFGPFLGAGWFIVLMFGTPLITWYQSLFIL
jgi:prepilin signal peptidase PulO-like enzyme (type II secretory pathway)